MCDCQTNETFVDYGKNLNKFKFIGRSREPLKAGTFLTATYRLNLAASTVSRRNLKTRFTPGEGGVLPYMGYIGMCGPKGYGFSAILVINWVSILAILPPFGSSIGYRFLHSNLQFGFF